jgi:pimeloyl-ACP methyl ester carboxylesterase
MAPVARELSTTAGILEPFQTQTTVDGQALELKTILEKNADVPVTLVGFSWGAWLSLIVAARYAALVKKLILISSPPFDESYAAQLRQTRRERLTPEERQEFDNILQTLADVSGEGREQQFARLGALAEKADAYDPIPQEKSSEETIHFRPDIFQSVWSEAIDLRRTGKLLGYARNLKCPVTAVHGDHDPSPAEGVRQPLSEAVSDFKFILLSKCGHKPWTERHAREEFYKILREELRV